MARLPSTQAIAVTVSNINEAPILNATPAVALAPIAEDAGAPAGAVGTLVSALVDIAGGGGWDNFSDPDLGASTGPGRDRRRCHIRHLVLHNQRRQQLEHPGAPPQRPAHACSLPTPRRGCTLPPPAISTVALPTP
jgi:hypothetical protein